MIFKFTYLWLNVLQVFNKDVVCILDKVLKLFLYLKLLSFYNTYIYLNYKLNIENN